MQESTPFVTKDGRPVNIRRIQETDTALLVDMYHHLSDETKLLRFHTYTGKLPDERIWKEAMALSHLDPARQVALAAVIQEIDGEHAVGIARFSRATPHDIEAETAIVVRDDYQRVGLGIYLLYKLAQIARSMGIKQLSGWVQAQNKAALMLLQKANLPYTQRTSLGETYLTISIEGMEFEPE